MKERIRNFIIAVVILAGMLTVGTVAKLLLPSVIFYTIFGLIVLYVLYDCSKPEKKKTETYWYYSFIGFNNGRTLSGYGIQRSKSEEFDFVGYLFEMRDCHITMVKEISREQYDKINGLIGTRKEEQSND